MKGRKQECGFERRGNKQQSPYSISNGFRLIRGGGKGYGPSRFSFLCVINVHPAGGTSYGPGKLMLPAGPTSTKRTKLEARRFFSETVAICRGLTPSSCTLLQSLTFLSKTAISASGGSHVYATRLAERWSLQKYSTPPLVLLFPLPLLRSPVPRQHDTADSMGY